MLSDFFDFGDERVYSVFQGCEKPWDPLHRLKGFIREFLAQNGTRRPESVPEGCYLQGDLYIEEGVLLEPGTFISGPTLLFKGAEVRFGAYIRGDVVVAEKALVGHDSEVKHSLLLPGAKAAHFAYVGDSVLGRSVNLGAGTKCANLKVDMGKSHVRVKIGETIHDSGLRKFGAVLGDGVSVGCNTVTNPGTVMGKNAMAYALSSLSGYYAPNSLIKTKSSQQVIQRNV